MTDPQSIRILSVDDHPLLREGIAAVTESEPDMTIVASDGKAHSIVGVLPASFVFPNNEVSADLLATS